MLTTAIIVLYDKHMHTFVRLSAEEKVVDVVMKDNHLLSNQKDSPRLISVVNSAVAYFASMVVTDSVGMASVVKMALKVAYSTI